MASLNSLPNELVHRILGFTHPGDLNNFSLINSRWSDVAAPFIDQRKERQKLYGHLAYEAPNAEWHQLVFDILAEPQLAWYVTSVEVDYSDILGPWAVGGPGSTTVPATVGGTVGVTAGGTVGGHDKSPTPEPPQLLGLGSDTRFVLDAIRSSIIPMNHDPEKWRKILLQGDQTFATYLLFTMLPRLVRLSVTVFHDFDEEVEDESDYAARGAFDFTRTMAAIADECQFGGSALSQLKYIEVKAADGLETINRLDFLGPVMALPQASALKITDLSTNSFSVDSDLVYGQELPLSNLTSLILLNSEIPLDALRHILDQTPLLQRLCLLQDDDEPHERSLQCRRTFTIARRHNGNSLRFIAFDALCFHRYDKRRPDPRACCPDLSGFDNLRAAYVPWTFIASTLREARTEVILPKLSCLSLHSGLSRRLSDGDIHTGTDYEGRRWRPEPLQLQSLVEQLVRRCPRLKRLLLLENEPRLPSADDLTPELRVACAKHGLATEARDWSTFHDDVLCGLNEEWRDLVGDEE